MTEQRVMPSKVTSAEVAAREFTRVRRGYDVAEVRQFLSVLAAELARLDADVQRAHSSVTVADVTPHKADRKELTAQLGETAARILDAAQEAADDTRAKAEASVARLLREARDEAAAIRTAATEARTALLDEAEAHAAQLRDEAIAERDRASHATEAEIARAKEEGRAMVAEAKELRERLLAEMNERRREARLQLEQLRAAGDHLRQEYLALRERLDEQLRRLDLAPSGAQAAADRVAATSLPDSWDDGAPAQAPPAVPTETHVQHPAEAAAPGPAPDGMEAEAPAPAAAQAAPPDEVHGEAQPEPEASAGTPAAVPADVQDLAGGPPDAGAPENGAAAGSSRPAAGDEPVSTPAAASREQDGDDGAVVLRLAKPPPDQTRPPGRPDESQPDQPRPAAPGAAGSAAATPAVASVPSVEEVRLRRQERARAIHRRQQRAPATSADADDRPPRDMGEGTAKAGSVAVATAAETATPDPVDRLFARLRAERTEADPIAGRPGVAVAEERSSVGSPVVDARSDAQADELAAELLGRRADATERVAPVVASGLKRAVNDWLNDLLDTLRAAKTSASAADLVGEGPAQRVADALRVTLPAALDAGRGQGGGRGGKVRNRHLDQAVSRMTAEIAGSIRARVLADPIDPGGLAERARSVVREWRQGKAGPTAVDAVRLAFGHGVLAAQPDRHLVRWLCPPEGCRSADCQDNSLAAPVPAGAPFPTGDVVAPACPGCGCLVVPVAS